MGKQCPKPDGSKLSPWNKFLSFLADLMYSKYPPFFYHYKEPRDALYGDTYIKLEEILEPGDIILRRYCNQISNFIYPSFYTHSAIFLGNKTQYGANRLIHSTSPGVQMTDLFSFLHKSHIAVIRPNVSNEEKERALERVISHTGKMFDYSLSFGKDKKEKDTFYCSELIYDAYKESIDKIGWKPKIHTKFFIMKRLGFAPDDLLPSETSNVEIVFKEKILD